MEGLKEMSTLCRCPFCGTDLVGVEREKDFPPRFYVMCHQCFARGGYDDTVSKAVNNWNMRSVDRRAV